VNRNVPTPGKNAEQHKNTSKDDDDAPDQRRIRCSQCALNVLGRTQAKDEAARGTELVHDVIKDREESNPEEVIGTIPGILFELGTFGALKGFVLGRLNAGV